MVRNRKKRKDPSTIIENALLKVSILGLLTLVFVQFFLSNHSMKAILSDSSTETTSIEESTLHNLKGVVEIEIVNISQYKKLSILKNGIKIQDTSPVNNIFNIEVLDGDVIEVDTTDYNESIKIRINDISENIDVPKRGQEYTSNQNIVYLFKAKISQED